jgi:hypothetical protein
MIRTVQVTDEIVIIVHDGPTIFGVINEAMNGKVEKVFDDL